MCIRDSSGTSRAVFSFVYRTFTFFGAAFQPSSTRYLWSLALAHNPIRPKTNGLGSSPFARRYWENLFWFPFLRLLRCFSSPGSPHTPMNSVHVDSLLQLPGFPIRTSMDQCLLATPHGFSQLTTSFFGSWCQGIRPTLFLAWSSSFPNDSLLLSFYSQKL